MDNLPQHHHTNQEQGTRSGCRRNDEEDGREEESQEEKTCYGEGCESCASAFNNTCCTFNVGSHCRCTAKGTNRCTDSISHQRFVEVGNPASGMIHHTGTCRSTNQCTDGIEQVHEQQCCHNNVIINVERDETREIHFQGNRLNGVRQAQNSKMLRNLSHTEGNAHHGHNQNGKEQGATHFQGQQDSTQQNATNSYNGSRSPRSETSYRSLVDHHDTTILQTDEGNEQTNTHRDRVADVQRNGIDNRLTDLQHGEQNEDKTLNQHRCQSLLPCVAHHDHQRVGKEGIQSHTRSQCKWHFGIKRHHGCSHHCSNHCGREHSTFLHTCVTQDNRVDSQDIRHSEEGGQSCHHLHFNRMFLGIEAQQR